MSKFRYYVLVDGGDNIVEGTDSLDDAKLLSETYIVIDSDEGKTLECSFLEAEDIQPVSIVEDGEVTIYLADEAEGEQETDELAGEEGDSRS